MVGFLELRNLLMDQHGWDRRVATIAARIYLGVDTPEILATTNLGSTVVPFLPNLSFVTSVAGDNDHVDDAICDHPAGWHGNHGQADYPVCEPCEDWSV